MLVPLQLPLQLLAQVEAKQVLAKSRVVRGRGFLQPEALVWALCLEPRWAWVWCLLAV